MKKSVYTILVCLAVFFTFYGVRYMGRPIKSQYAVSEVYENKIVTTGYIIKTEQVYNSTVSGRVYHYLQEGTKVKKNNILSTVYTGDVSEQTLAELNSINQKISEIQNSSNPSYSFGSNSQENIDIIKNNIIKSANRNDLSDMDSYKAQINSIVTGGVEDIRTDNLESLENKKHSIESTLQSSKNDVYSQMAGVFSKNIDGMEETLKPGDILSYRLSDYEAIKLVDKKPQTAVNIGEPICKVINNNTWYIMTAVKSESVSKMRTGQKVKIRFTELPGIEANGVISYISAEESNTEKNVVVIKCELYKEGVLSLRFTGIELVLESYEGYRIPMSAIRNKNGVKEVMVRTESGTFLRKCKILYTDIADQTVIISKEFDDTKGMLKETDSIIIGEK